MIIVCKQRIWGARKDFVFGRWIDLYAGDVLLIFDKNDGTLGLSRFRALTSTGELIEFELSDKELCLVEELR